jgi:hypothetical protein
VLRVEKFQLVGVKIDKINPEVSIGAESSSVETEKMKFEREKLQLLFFPF